MRASRQTCHLHLHRQSPSIHSIVIKDVVIHFGSHAFIISPICSNNHLLHLHMLAPPGQPTTLISSFANVLHPMLDLSLFTAPTKMCISLISIFHCCQSNVYGHLNFASMTWTPSLSLSPLNNRCHLSTIFSLLLCCNHFRFQCHPNCHNSLELPNLHPLSAST